MNNKELENIIANGVLVIDVRTPEEYKDGHIEGSLNIPLNEIEKATSWLVKDVPIITVCASGNRSTQAIKILEARGFEKVYNGGSWNNLGKIKVGACLIK
jgi:rhodanese-related sulfurtransferase